MKYTTVYTLTLYLSSLWEISFRCALWLVALRLSFQLSLERKLEISGYCTSVHTFLFSSFNEVSYFWWVSPLLSSLLSASVCFSFCLWLQITLIYCLGDSLNYSCTYKVYPLSLSGVHFLEKESKQHLPVVATYNALAHRTHKLHFWMKLRWAPKACLTSHSCWNETRDGPKYFCAPHAPKCM